MPRQRLPSMLSPFVIDPGGSNVGESAVARLTGGAVAVGGLGLMGAGLWARRDVTRTLARERISPVESGSEGGFVSSGAEARSLAEFIRRNTLEATGGRTYAEVDAYLDADGHPTSDAAQAAKDPVTAAPVENPDHALWIQSTTLQAALIQAYTGFRLAELTVALGGAFAATGLGIVLASRSRR